MHTVICAFGDRRAALNAMDSLMDGGFDPRDMHLEYRGAHADGTPLSLQHWQSHTRDVAADRGIVRSFGAFLASVLGVDDPSGHVDTYTQHVDRGGYVLVLDARDPLDAQRANALLRGAGAVDSLLIERKGQRRIREIVADNQTTMTGMTTGMQNH